MTNHDYTEEQMRSSVMWKHPVKCTFIIQF